MCYNVKNTVLVVGILVVLIILGFVSKEAKGEEKQKALLWKKTSESEGKKKRKPVSFYTAIGGVKVEKIVLGTIDPENKDTLKILEPGTCVFDFDNQPYTFKGAGNKDNLKDSDFKKARVKEGAQVAFKIIPKDIKVRLRLLGDILRRYDGLSL